MIISGCSKLLWALDLGRSQEQDLRGGLMTTGNPPCQQAAPQVGGTGSLTANEALAAARVFAFGRRGDLHLGVRHGLLFPREMPREGSAGRSGRPLATKVSPHSGDAAAPGL